MEKNPVVVFSYVNKIKTKKMEVGHFKVGEEYENYPRKIWTMLSLLFRTRNEENTDNKICGLLKKKNAITDTAVIKRNAVIARDKLSENSVQGLDGILAILKRTKVNSKTMMLLLRQSLADSSIARGKKNGTYVASTQNIDM